MTISRDLLRLKLAESLASAPPALTRREVRLPGIRGKAPLLIQVCLETSDDDTWTREVRSLKAAKVAHRTAHALLVTGDATPPSTPLPSGLTWMSAAQWLLEDGT